MSRWSEIDREIGEAVKAKDPVAVDSVRRKYSKRLAELTGRPLLIYAADWVDMGPAKTQVPIDVGINWSDVQHFEDILRGVAGPNLDVVVHSPGGSPQACESLVKLLRRSYTHVRFIVPGIVKSAATMLVMSGDEILVDPNAEFGPIDPQMILSRQGRGKFYSPAQAILDEFEAAKEAVIQEPDTIAGWYPIIQEMGPSLLAECRNAIRLSKRLVAVWLKDYMFRGEPGAAARAARIAAWLGHHNNFLSHGRCIDAATLQAKGVKVRSLQDQPELLEVVRRLYCALGETFGRTGCYKLYENGAGESICRVIVTKAVSAAGSPAGAGAVSPPANRAARRAAARGKR